MDNIDKKMYDIFLGMYKEMVISNQPENLKKPQRELFEVINSIRHFSSMIENNTTNVEKYIEWRDKYEEQYEKLIDMGCVDIDI